MVIAVRYLQLKQKVIFQDPRAYWGLYSKEQGAVEVSAASSVGCIGVPVLESMDIKLRPVTYE